MKMRSSPAPFPFFLRVLLVCLFCIGGQEVFSQQDYSFMVIHCDPPETNPADSCGYPGKVDMQKLGLMVRKADQKGAKLTLQFSPAWVDSILADTVKWDTVRAWQQRGHEIAGHHHHYGHQYWDGYMNDPGYADSIPSGCGVYLGQTEDFYSRLRTLCGDSLFLTLGQGPNNDAAFLQYEWSQGVLYKTNDRTNQPPPFGGRVTDDAFSNVEKDTMGIHVTCKISYCFIDDTYMGYDSLYRMIDKMNAPAYAGYKIIGAVTHPFNYSIPAGDTIFNYWMDTITQIVPVMTVREIMRAKNCSGETLTSAPEVPQGTKITVYPNPAGDRIRIECAAGTRIREVELFDPFGRRVYRSLPGDSPDHVIDLGQLSPGTYFLRLDCGDEVLYKRVSKL